MTALNTRRGTIVHFGGRPVKIVKTIDFDTLAVRDGDGELFFAPLKEIIAQSVAAQPAPVALIRSARPKSRPITMRSAPCSTAKERALKN